MPIYILTLVFIATFISTNLVSAQEEQVKDLSWDVANTNKPYVALVNEYDVDVNEDYSYQEVYHARVKVQQQDALDLGEWPVFYNKSREKINEIKAYTESPDGKKLEAKDIRDEAVYPDAAAFSDMRVKIVKFPQLAVGNIIDVTIKSTTLTKEIPNSFWHIVALPVIPTKYVRYGYSFPTSLPIKFKAFNNTIKPTITEKNGRTSYSFKLENTEYQGDEDYAPPSDMTEGVLSFSSINDWAEVVNWYREAINKATVDDAQISVKALELIKDKATAKDKARAIIEYLQDNFKYVAVSSGDHGVSLHSTSTIFANQYGDTKDLALIARQMLALAGIKADICLFSGEFNGDPRNRLPNPNVFDHLILQVTLDGATFYLDPQAKGFDFGQLPSSYDNAYVLVIEDDKYHFDQLPIANEDFNAVVSSSDITISDDGSAIFEVKVSLPYEASVQFKQQWVGASKENQEKFFDQLQTNFTPGGKMLDRQITGINDRYSKVEFTLKYQAPNAYPKVNDMILLKEADQSNLTELPEGTRALPIFFPSNSIVRNTNTYHYPATMTIDSTPIDYNFDSDFMQVSVNYTKTPSTVIVKAVYRTKRVVLEPKRYDEVKSFRDQLLKKNDQYVVLKQKSTITPQAKEWVKEQ